MLVFGYGDDSSDVFDYEDDKGDDWFRQVRTYNTVGQ